MDLDDSPAEAAFRADARAWLAGHAEPKTGQIDWARRHGSPEEAARHVRRCKEWQSALYEGRWAGITWPEEFGGRGGSPMEQVIFNQEQSRFEVSVGAFTVALAMAGPTLIAHGTVEQRSRYLGPILRGEELWCQLFSEPGAGSDLAGLSTRAVLDGEEWVVNGQKVWTSGAQHSDFAILLARTDPDVPKHRGLTYFVLDMRTPGIEVRPLRQINRVAHFNEVFLTDVRVPSTSVVGAVNGGWGVALTTLANERAAIGGGEGGLSFEGLVDLARLTERIADPVVRQGLARSYTSFQLIRYLGFRIQTALSRGRGMGPEGSVLKLLYSRYVSQTGDLAVGMEGASGTLIDDDALLEGLWQQQLLGQFGVRIGGGTDEVQRNVIGDRVLGLPGEPRTDKGVPFKELARTPA